jgi:hypothetical protein
MQTIGYNTSKGAVISMTRDLATSWARYGINVNAIAPGWFPTKMSGGLIEQFEEKMLEDIPMHRFGNPEDIKGVVKPGGHKGRGPVPGIARCSVHDRPDGRRGRGRYGLVTRLELPPRSRAATYLLIRCTVTPPPPVNRLQGLLGSSLRRSLIGSSEPGGSDAPP